VESGDVSKQLETTIKITTTEFDSLSSVTCRKVEKTRYFYKYNELTAEFDVFEGDLQGLVLVDFEFESEPEKASFAMPDFCLAEITQETFIAGGVLAGKNFNDVQAELARFSYQKLHLV
jgi:CYTH domain-containing protein